MNPALFWLDDLSHYLLQIAVVYVVFVLAAASLVLWSMASLLNHKWKAYVVSVTFLLAIVIILGTVAIHPVVGLVTLAVLVYGPCIFSAESSNPGRKNGKK